MKKNIRFLTTMFVLVFVQNIYAMRILYGQFMFDIDDSKFTATVVQDDNYKSMYKIEIPAYISLGDVSYTVTKIGDGCFADCVSLMEACIPYTIEELGDRSFYNCCGLKYINIPPFLKRIGDFCFYGTNLTINVELPNTLEYLGDCAFAHSPINLISLPSSLTNIGVQVFFSCSQLTHVHLYNSNIDMSIFEECRRVCYVYCYGRKPPYTSGTHPFDFDKYVEINIPKGSIEEFKQATGWSNLWNYKEMNPISPRPLINFKDGIISLTSEIDSPQYRYSIRSNDITSESVSSSGIIRLKSPYIITASVSSDEYSESEKSVAILYWLTKDVVFQADEVKDIDTRGVVVQSQNGVVHISGISSDEVVSFYSTSGQMLGTVKAVNGNASFAAHSGSVIVAKIGEESVKIQVTP